jgi:hypothetical protein
LVNVGVKVFPDVMVRTVRMASEVSKATKETRGIKVIKEIVDFEVKPVNRVFEVRRGIRETLVHRLSLTYTT